MQDKNVPTLDTHYWVTFLVASVLGTMLGDFAANDLGLGFAGGLLFVIAVIAVIFIAESKLKWNSVAWYWAAIVATRIAATNLGDFLSRTLKLGNGSVSAILAGLLIVFLFVTRRASGATVSNLDADNSVKLLPKTNARYWAAILIASTLGTPLGDFISGDLDLGVRFGSLTLLALLAAVLILEITVPTANEVRYWAVIAVVRTTGTVMGDCLTKAEGLKLGFAVGASLVGVLLVILVLLPRILAVARLSR